MSIVVINYLSTKYLKTKITYRVPMMDNNGTLSDPVLNAIKQGGKVHRDEDHDTFVITFADATKAKQFEATMPVGVTKSRKDDDTPAKSKRKQKAKAPKPTPVAAEPLATPLVTEPFEQHPSVPGPQPGQPGHVPIVDENARQVGDILTD